MLRSSLLRSTSLFTAARAVGSRPSHFAVRRAFAATTASALTQYRNASSSVNNNNGNSNSSNASEATQSASSSSSSTAPPLTPEEIELEKDKQALKYAVMGVITLLSSAWALWYGNKIASKRYRGDDNSVLVGVESRGRPALGGPFTLVSTDGEPMSQARFLGKWTFFYFGFVHCPEICPIELNRMTKVVDAVHKERPDMEIAPLFVSCDPKRDSLMAIKEYLSVFHKDFIGLVGTPNQVAETCKSYRIYYSVPDQQAEDSGDYIIDHSIAIFLFDPQGRFVDFFGNRFSEQEITEKVLGYMDKYNKDPTWTNY